MPERNSGRSWSTTPATRQRWDVFLNFRGEDTRHGFTIPLRDELSKNGVRAFFDDEGLRQGDSLDPVLFDAIRDSGAAIAIISPNYASSRWCLEELAAICECRRLILPVFYCVDPSHVRNQSGPFEGHFRKLEGKFRVEMVGRWRRAMETIGKLKGRVFRESSDAAVLIQLLVNDINNEMKNSPQYVAPYIVGIDYRMQELLTLLNPLAGGTKVLGLHGMGGVGKTTLAKALFNKLVSHFKCRSFISNIREASLKEDGLMHLKNKLIQDLCPGRMAMIGTDDSKIKDKLPKQPVLVVLDDVDHAMQLSALTEERAWFYEGSRIIITTRNQQVLLPQFVTETYEVRELSPDDSLQLFSYHAFRMEKPHPEFSSLSEKIVSITGHLPLALEVFGSFLFDKRSVEIWEDIVLKQLKEICPGDLQQVLRISYDGLCKPEKRVFLDLACLLLELEMKIDDSIDILQGCGFSAVAIVDVLIQRSLLKAREDDKLWMHDQIREMGRQIVLDEDRVDAGKRSRLWDYREILGVLEDQVGTGSIEGIILSSEKIKVRSDNIMTASQIASNNIWRGRLSWASISTFLKDMYMEHIHGSSGYQLEGGEKNVLHTESFQSMNNLRLLHLSGVKLEGNFEHLPAKLKLLQWKNCPLKNLPLATHRELAVLDLSESKIETLWQAQRWYQDNPKVAKNLTIINLYGCYNIRSIPDLSSHSALRKLNLERCTSLLRIHKSIGDLTSLQHLNLKDCSGLLEFPQNVSGLKNLETLDLSGCLQLKQLPNNMKMMSSLKELLIARTSIQKLPESIILLTKLEKIHARGCVSLTNLPTGIGNLSSLKELILNESGLRDVPVSIGSLKNLQELNLMSCTMVKSIPDSICNLKSLRKFWINGSSVAELPASIGSMHYLEELSIATCTQISTLPVSVGCLASMVDLQLDGTSIMELPGEISGLKSLSTLQMRNCGSLTGLPETIGELLALKTLIIANSAIIRLPESIGKLESLVLLNINQCEKLSQLPDSIGKLQSLHHLLMEKTNVSELPNSFGKLSNLRTLKMGKVPSQQTIPSSDLPKIVPLPPSFSDLSLLHDFDAKAFGISGEIPDEFEKLSSLETLNLAHNQFHSLPSSLRGLTLLTELSLEHCKELKVLPPLPSSLVKVNAAYCIAMERVIDLSNLKSLKELNLANCEKLVEISGLECLESLIRLYMSGCNLCSSYMKEKLNKVSLKKLHGLSMPGRLVPDWFKPDSLTCSIPRNNAIKSVIIVVVVAINHQVKDDIRDQAPVIPGVQAKLLRLGNTVFSTDLYLPGVPTTDEDQVYLCWYPEYHPLVSILRDNDQIVVAMRNPMPVQGVELKKSGIYVVFENDDDHDGDEELLDESSKTISERLTNEIKGSSEGNGMQ